MCTGCMYTVYRCPDILGAPVGVRDVYQVYVHSVYLPVVLGVQMYRAHKWVRDVYLVYVHGVYIPGVLGVQMYWVH